MQVKVLIVEDDELILTMMKINLEREGYFVKCLKDAESMLDCINQDCFDVILLDIKLPGMSGEEALNRIKKSGIETPVIMVTAKNDINVKVNTLNCGADDYIAKPFNIKELLARVKAVVRRCQGKRVIPSHRMIKIGNFNVNLETRMAATNLGEMLLSEKESNLLAFFNQHIGKTLRRDDILDEVWGIDSDPTPRTIDNYIVKFRKLFEKNPDNPIHFITVHSAGYRFTP